MAIFDFVKQAGQTLSDGLGAAASAATDAAAGVMEKASVAGMQLKIKEAGIETKDLALKWVDDETVKIYTVVGSVEDKEKLILLIGNTQGVAKVEDAIKVRDGSGAAVEASTASKFYTVKSGDTLGAIAGAELGSTDRYMEIFEMNRHILSDPDSIDVGQTLRLPQS